MESQKSLVNDIRKEIQALIPNITTVNEDANGNKKYSGDALEVLISRMKSALNIDEVGNNVSHLCGILPILIGLGRKLAILGESHEASQYWKTRVPYTDIGQRAGGPRKSIERRGICRSY